MPIFEYSCKDCGKTSELIVRADTKIVCEHCGSKKVDKLMSTFAAHEGGKSAPPPCSGGCGGGFQQGQCGSGMCGMGG